MSGIRSRIATFGKRRVAFTIVVVVVLVFFLLQSWENYVLIVAGWFEPGLGILTADEGHHFLHVAHRLHNSALSLVTWPFLIGMAAQLRSPTRHVTGMLMAVFVWLTGLIAIGLTGAVPFVIIVAIMGIPTVIAAVLHPAGRELLTSFDAARVSRVLLGLVVVAAVPLLGYAAYETGLQTGAIEAADHAHDGGEHAEIHDEHVGGGHYMRMVWLAFVIIGTGLLASFRQPGWWLGAWVAGLMAVVFGGIGILAPEAASNPGLLWNLAAIAWGVGFIGTAEMTQDTESPTPLGARKADRGSVG